MCVHMCVFSYLNLLSSARASTLVPPPNEWPMMAVLSISKRPLNCPKGKSLFIKLMTSLPSASLSNTKSTFRTSSTRTFTCNTPSSLQHLANCSCSNLFISQVKLLLSLRDMLMQYPVVLALFCRPFWGRDSLQRNTC